LLIFLWACLSLYILISIDLLSFSLRRTGWLRFVSTFFLFYAQLIGTEFLLGLTSWLHSYSLVVLNALISTLVLFILRKKFGRTIFGNYLNKTRKLTGNFKQSFHKDPLWLAIFALAAGFVGYIIFLGVIFPVTDFDGNSYHLTYIANLIQNHNIYDAKTSLTWLAGYPKGGELIQAWSMLITHNDTFVDLTQIPFLLLGVAALYEIAISLGADKKQARFSAILFIFLPIVLNQLKTSYVDVMVPSLFFAGLAMAIRRKLSKLDFAIVGILFSILISLKSTGFLFVLILLPFIIWNLYRNYGFRLKRYIQPVLLLGLPTSFGLYWYVKDYILYGSPIYPFGFKLAGLTIFPGKTFQEFAAEAVKTTALPHSCVQRIWFVWTEQKDWFGCLYNYDTNYAGLGPIWFIILIPALILSLYFAVKRRNNKYLVVVGSILALFAIYPSNYYSRYTMFITAGGIFALALVLTNVSKFTSNLVKTITVVLAISVIATNFVLCNFPPGVVRGQLRSFIHGSERGPIYANTPGEAFVFLENRVRPNEVVEYDSSPYFIYPLWRADFTDKVIYIPAANKTAWYHEAVDRHVKYLFTTIGSKENGWATGKLKEIYKDEMYEIFQAS